MRANPTFQSNRFELKYLIDEDRASAVRGHVLGQLRPDPFMKPSSPQGYMVYSVYLDSPGLDLCRATVNGEKNRFKLRIRYYDAIATNPVFFEIKRRVSDAIIKTRASVYRRAVSEIIQGRALRENDLINPNKFGAIAALSKFCELRKQINAQPVTTVAYQREAYSNMGDGSARVTLDRRLRGADWSGDFTDLDGSHWQPAPIDGVILELKFKQRFPQWMAQLVRKFDLQRRSVPKYVECANALKSPALPSIGMLGRLAAYSG